MFSPTELDAMRATLEASLPDTCEVQRKTLTPDGMGGHTESWATVATVPCRVAPSGRAQERAVAERLSAVSVWTVTVPAGLDVGTADRLLVGERTFEVVAAFARSYEIGRRLVCTEVV